MATSIEEIITQRKAERQVTAAAPVKEEKETSIRENPTEVVPPSRKRRGVFNGTQSKINVTHTIPGYHLHVFTDLGGRIQDALDDGYEFVSPKEVGGVSENVVSRNGDLGDRIRYLVNPRADGTEQYGYLMKKREEWWLEDQEELQAKNSRIDAAIRKGKVTGDNPAFYIPPGGIKVT